MLRLGPRPRIIGIVNVTPDSFSDGGLYLSPARAISHARRLYRAGADLVELGAASSNPDAQVVTAAEELRRLRPVLSELQRDKRLFMLDSCTPKVQAYGIANGVQMVNDIRGFPDKSIYPHLKKSDCSLVVMHSVNAGPRAKRWEVDAASAYASACRFFERRLKELTGAGVANRRLVLDPGMGFFLSTRPEASLAMLRQLPSLHRQFGLPLFVSVSRKSFLRNLTPQRTGDTRIRTVAAELFLRCMPVSYIRTHDVRALREALLALEAIVGGLPLESKGRAREDFSRASSKA